jgi:hypothetical protein
MNTNDIIQEAAEALYPKHYLTYRENENIFKREECIKNITHFLTHAKEKHGAELVKVEGDDEAIANHLFKAEVNTFTDSTGFDVQVVGYADFVTAIKQAIAIGREQGRKEANEDTIRNLNKLAGVNPPKTEL